MKDRGKAIEISEAFTSEPPCRKHPSSTSVGICAICLKDRLLKLVCSDCGEPRLSSCSCSCSDISNRNSLSVDVGTGGPISFLIHNDVEDRPISNHAQHALQRSSSTCLDGRRSSFWQKGWFSRRRSEQGIDVLGRRSDSSWDVKCRASQSFSSDVGEIGVPRSAICESKHKVFRKTSSHVLEQEGDETDSEFFDLNVELFSSKSRLSFRDNKVADVLGRVTSCRVTVNEIAGRGRKKGSKVLKWIFRHSGERNPKK